MGERVPREPRSIEALANLHDNLLAGARGRFINSLGAISADGTVRHRCDCWWPWAPGKRSAAWRRVSSSRQTAHGARQLGAPTARSASGCRRCCSCGRERPLSRASDRLRRIGNGLDRLDTDSSLSATMYQWWLVKRRSLRTVRRQRNQNAVGGIGLAPAFLFATGLFVWWTRVKTSDRGDRVRADVDGSQS